MAQTPLLRCATWINPECQVFHSSSGLVAIADAAAAAAAIAGMGGPGLSYEVKDAVKEERWLEKDRGT